MKNKNLKINAATAFGLAAALFTSAPDIAGAQMAKRIPMSPPLLEIMMTDPFYGVMLGQFRDLMNGPRNEMLQPFDYVTMALFAFQGAKDNQGLRSAEAFDTILLSYGKCQDATRRQQIINNAMEIGNWLPDKMTEAMDAVARAFDEEQNAGLRAYEVTLIQRMAQKVPATITHARKMLSRMAQDKNEQVSALAGRISKMFAEMSPGYQP